MTPTPINLSKSTPREIERLLAVHVAGWKPTNRDHGFADYKDERGIPRYSFDVPSYLSDAGAILGLLEKELAISITRIEPAAPNTWRVDIFKGSLQGKSIGAVGNTFPLAAATALLRAAGVECGEG